MQYITPPSVARRALWEFDTNVFISWHTPCTLVMTERSAGMDYSAPLMWCMHCGAK